MKITDRMFRRMNIICATAMALVLAGSLASAHSPTMDSDASDWCVGAFSLTAPGGGRIEDSGGALTCGTCSVTTDLACVVPTDCPSGESCITAGTCSISTGTTCVEDTDCPGAETCDNAKREIAWWDDNFDGAVNDLATVAITLDKSNMYIAAQLWVDPDPRSLPFGQIAIDYKPGGLNVWHDPNNVLVNAGRCSGSTDRSCTTDQAAYDAFVAANPALPLPQHDCHFCAVSTEPFPSTRKRVCGSGCNPDIPTDYCYDGDPEAGGPNPEPTETCVALGDQGLIPGIGIESGPRGDADLLLLFDFGFWLLDAEDGNSVLVTQPAATPNPFTWTLLDLLPQVSAWEPVFGCAPDFPGDGSECDFVPVVNPGASGGSGGPPGSIEVQIPWEAFGCTGCPSACSCPGLGPGVPFRFSMNVSRGTTSLDFSPDGAFEDVFSELIAGTTTTTLDSCAAGDADNTDCELADGSSDAYIPNLPLPHEVAAGGRNGGLRVDKAAAGAISLDWAGSCSAGDVGYGVYEGTFGGSWNNHSALPGKCDLVGNSTPVTPSGANNYYLVVPSSATVEGSYGADDIIDATPGERAVGTVQCHGQILGTCP